MPVSEPESAVPGPREAGGDPSARLGGESGTSEAFGGGDERFDESGVPAAEMVGRKKRRPPDGLQSRLEILLEGRVTDDGRQAEPRQRDPRRAVTPGRQETGPARPVVASENGPVPLPRVVQAPLVEAGAAGRLGVLGAARDRRQTGESESDSGGSVSETGCGAPDCLESDSAVRS